MKRTAFVVAVFGVMAALGCVGYIPLRDAERKAEATREASKMMELRTRLAPELETCYQTHGAYPRKLQDLPLENFDWGTEGATPGDLKSFAYVCDGLSFVLRWNGASGSGVYLAGNKGESKFSEPDPVAHPGN